MEKIMMDQIRKFDFVYQSLQTNLFVKDGIEYTKPQDKKTKSKLDLSELKDLAALQPQEGEVANIAESVDQSQAFSPPLTDAQLNEEILKFQLQVDPTLSRPRSHSLDLKLERKNKTFWESVKATTGKKVSFFWDNTFFDRLFPSIKQQKPGKDLYVGIAGSAIIIIIYIILLYSQMSGINSSTISQQFSNNQFSGAMVLTMCVMIAIMVVDRYLYSTQSFEQKQRKSDAEEEVQEDRPMKPVEALMINTGTE
jgi:hypothetical protein